MNASQALPSTRPEPFEAHVPGSKSYTNRALLLAAMRTGTTRVSGGLHCDDTDRLARALDGFQGLSVEKTDEGYRAERSAAVLRAPEHALDLGGAGTPTRFLIAFAAAVEGVTRIDGNTRLRERPMVDILTTLRAQGIRFEHPMEADHLPVDVHGGATSSRDWSIRADTSSQFTSSLLLFASQQSPDGGPVRVELEGNVVSKPYVEMTIDMMNRAGIRVAREGERTIVVHPGAPQHDEVPVEVDASGMSYFLAAAAVTGTTVVIRGIGKDSRQGDVGLARAFERMGCKLELGSDEIRLTGGPLKGIEIDMDTMPDVVLTLAAVAALAEGETRVTNIANLRLKECDRIHAACHELQRLGVPCEEGPDFLVVKPGGAATNLKGAHVETYDDHRVAMAFAILGLVQDGITFEDPHCVVKSFPRFWAELDRFREHHGAEALFAGGAESAGSPA